MDLTIYHADTKSLLSQKLFPQLLERLPLTLHSRANRYKSQIGSYNYVVGRLLLKHGLDVLGYDSNLERIQFQNNEKPYLPDVEFNISHSEHQVICAFASEGRIGVDIEKVRAIDFEEFVSMFSIQEWVVIKASNNPLQSFYWFWTRKESIIKALGLTLKYLHQIELDISVDHFVINGTQWFLRELDLGNEFVGTVCCEREIGDLNLVELKF